LKGVILGIKGRVMEGRIMVEEKRKGVRRWWEGWGKSK